MSSLQKVQDAVKITCVINVIVQKGDVEAEPEVSVDPLVTEVTEMPAKSEWVDRRPPMSPKYHNRHQEYVASGACPAVWYGVLEAKGLGS